jgi:hypothetical protein
MLLASLLDSGQDVTSVLVAVVAFAALAALLKLLERVVG